MIFQGHVTSSVTWTFDSPHVIFCWWSFGTKPLYLTVSEIFNVKRNAMVDATVGAKLFAGFFLKVLLYDDVMTAANRTWSAIVPFCRLRWSGTAIFFVNEILFNICAVSFEIWQKWHTLYAVVFAAISQRQGKYNPVHLSVCPVRSCPMIYWKLESPINFSSNVTEPALRL